MRKQKTVNQLIEQLIEIENNTKNLVSLDYEIKCSDGPNDTNLINLLASEDETPEEKVIREDEENKMHELIQKCLDDREIFIIEHRFGFHNNRIYTLKEIALSLNITRERVRQIQNVALEKLKQGGKSYGK